MTPFELAEPTSLADAIALLDPNDTAVRPIAGGTAMMLMMKMGIYEPQKLVSLRKIEPRYSEISATDGGGLRIVSMGGATRRIEGRTIPPCVPSWVVGGPPPRALLGWASWAPPTGGGTLIGGDRGDRGREWGFSQSNSRDR